MRGFVIGSQLFVAWHSWMGQWVLLIGKGLGLPAVVQPGTDSRGAAFPTRVPKVPRTARRAFQLNIKHSHVNAAQQSPSTAFLAV